MRAHIVFAIVAAVAFGAASSAHAARLPPLVPLLLAAQGCHCDAEAARLQEARDRLSDLQERLRELEDQRRANAAAQDAARKTLADLQAQWDKQLGGGPGSGTGTFASSGGVEVRYNAQGQIQTYNNGQPVAGSERRSPFMSGLKAKIDAAEAALKKLQDEQTQIDQQIQQTQQDIAKGEQDVAARQKELDDCIRRCAAATRTEPTQQHADYWWEPGERPLTFRNAPWYLTFFTGAIANVLDTRAPMPFGRVQAADDAAIPNHVFEGLFRPPRPPLTFRNLPWWMYFHAGSIRTALGLGSPVTYDPPIIRGVRAPGRNVSPATATTPGGPIVRDRAWFFYTGGDRWTATGTTNVEQRLEGTLQETISSSDPSTYTGRPTSDEIRQLFEPGIQALISGTPARHRTPYFYPEHGTSNEFDSPASYFLRGAFGTHTFKTGAGEAQPPVSEYKLEPSNFFNTGSRSHQPKLGLRYDHDAGSSAFEQPALGFPLDDVAPRLGMTYSVGAERKTLLGENPRPGTYSLGGAPAESRNLWWENPVSWAYETGGTTSTNKPFDYDSVKSLQNLARLTDLMLLWNLQNAFYSLSPAGPIRIDVSGRPTDDTYQLIILVSINYQPPLLAAMPDEGRAPTPSRRPWIVRAFAPVKSWVTRTTGSSAVTAASLRVGPASASGAREIAPFLAAAAAGAQRGGQPSSALPISLVATGASSGEVFELAVPNRPDAPRHIVAPDGLVVQSIRQPAGTVAQQGGARQAVTGFCLDYQKPPPPKNMLYQVAPEAVQKKFEPMRKILEAGRDLAQAGALKPDSNPADYATFIRQWALWTRLNNWDMDAFTREFVARTRKNVENVGRRWNADMEAALKSAAPNRYWDILAVLAEAEGLRVATQP
jgi:hypothetical protein